jgi:hypothetical protein
MSFIVNYLILPTTRTGNMQELIDKLKTEAGLTEEQAKKAIDTIKSFVVEKFPMLEGAVNNVFGGN